MKNTLIQYFKTYYPYLISVLMLIGSLQEQRKNDLLIINYKFGEVLSDIKKKSELDAKKYNDENIEYNSGRRIYRLDTWRSRLSQLDLESSYQFSTYFTHEDLIKIIKAFEDDSRIKALLEEHPIAHNNFAYNLPWKSIPITWFFSLLFSTILILFISTISYLNKKWTLIGTMKKSSIVFIVIFLIQIVRNFV